MNCINHDALKGLWGCGCFVKLAVSSFGAEEDNITDYKCFQVPSRIMKAMGDNATVKLSYSFPPLSGTSRRILATARLRQCRCHGHIATVLAMTSCLC